MIAVISKGEVDAIQLSVTPPEDNEVLIKNDYAGVTISDLYYADLGIFVASFPAVLGTTVSGTIIGVGKGVTDLKIGDRSLPSRTKVEGFTGVLNCASLHLCAGSRKHISRTGRDSSGQLHHRILHDL
ncbi:hypothetical protein HGRIS_008564 [Hohenbuehelia grisea]|uniref:Alcohol dehydrogenase-like N-terminal domain-containing protein n=1 Tax=Hohenbuehelia grisea TaxID=104357 RepID=A0ABR3J8E8_9AGAR